MAKKQKLSQQQKSDIKRLYMQFTDEQLSEIVGSNAKDIKSFLESENLQRNEYTKNKLNTHIEVTEVVSEEINVTSAEG